MDNDGNLDIIGGSSDPGRVAIWYGDGTGNMSAPQFLPFKADVHCVAAADLNGDGLKDLIMSVQRESSGIMVWMNEGDRRWERGTSPIEVNNYEGIRIADINRDGYMDVIAANSTSEDQGGIQVWLGNGKGGWMSEAGPTVTGRYMDVAVGDFNGDAKLDIAGASWGTYGAVRVWLGDGTGDWTPMPPVASGNFYGLKLCDINGDGKADILAGSYRKGVFVFLGNGDGTFTQVPGPVDQGSFWRAIGADINHDGVTDIVAGSIDGGGISGWINKGGNRWEPYEGVFPTVGNFYDFKMADLDHDGHPEMIFASYGEGIKIVSGKTWPFSKSIRGLTDESNDENSDQAQQVSENSVFTTVDGHVEYRVGPRDILEITMWTADQPNKEDVEIMADGTLSFSFVQNLQVNGLTVKQVQKKLTQYLKTYIRNPRVDVRVKYYRSKKVSIMGPGRWQESGGGSGSAESGNPGFYLEGKVTILEMLSRTRAARSDANLREVTVRRKNGQTLKLNLYRAMTLGDNSQNIVLDNGDVIYLPLISKEGNRVFIFGEVRSPGAYSFTGSSMHMLDAIAAAGGPTVFAKAEYTKVVRGDIANPEVISVNLKKLLETGDQSQNTDLKDGDLVYVPESAIGDINKFVQRIRPLVDLVTLPGRNIGYIPLPNNLDTGTHNR